jgi:hypothetical protein
VRVRGPARPAGRRGGVRAAGRVAGSGHRRQRDAAHRRRRRALARRARRATGPGTARRPLLTAAPAGAATGGHHRDQRQDDERVPAQVGPRGRGPAVWPSRHGLLQPRAPRSGRRRGRRRRRRTCRPCCARCGARVHRRRHGGVVARAGAPRVDGLQFAAGLFTNLTRDHLDFHRDMEDYAAAKRRLFQMLGTDAPGVVNADDPRAGSFAQVVAPHHLRRAPPGRRDRRRRVAHARGPGVRGADARRTAGSIRSALVGRPNVYNILGVVATAIALGIPREAIERGIAGLQGVPGPLRARLRRTRRHHRHRRLRAHRRRAAQPARDGARARARGAS